MGRFNFKIILIMPHPGEHIFLITGLYLENEKK